MAQKTISPDLDLKTQPNLADPAIRKKLSRAAIQGLLKITEEWNLKNAEAIALLGGISQTRYYKLKRTHQGVLTQDELTRVSLLVGVFRALHVLFHGKFANEWVSRRNSNPMFKNASPLSRMIEAGIPGILAVRRLLDAHVHGQ